MPVFHAPRTFDPRLVLRVVYSLSIVAPMVEPTDGPPGGWIIAHVVPEPNGCFISTSLAKDFNPLIKNGDLLQLVAVEEDIERKVLHRFPFVVPVTLKETKIEDYLQIGFDLLQFAFNLAIPSLKSGDSASAEFLKLTVRRCIQTSLDDGDVSAFA
jgi:hypothetical protein